MCKHLKRNIQVVQRNECMCQKITVWKCNYFFFNKTLVDTSEEFYKCNRSLVLLHCIARCEWWMIEHLAFLLILEWRKKYNLLLDHIALHNQLISVMIPKCYVIRTKKCHTHTTIFYFKFYCNNNNNVST